MVKFYVDGVTVGDNIASLSTEILESEYLMTIHLIIIMIGMHDAVALLLMWLQDQYPRIHQACRRGRGPKEVYFYIYHIWYLVYAYIYPYLGPLQLYIYGT